MYDGVFEVLQWLLFLSAVPPVQLLTGWCVTAKALPDISTISALTAVKHGNCSSLTPLLNPVRTRKYIDMAMNGVGCRATARIMGVSLNTIYVT
ncbi:Transposase [Shigella dysenteriae 1617]|uniref:Transposase n=1 Tax=Shigella dysenteriae 1617 TaxID=754093 RepID=A0A0A6ZST9_SHIDY|nr:Transposase [Shigella dysenteriae 1617]AHA66955.1 Transposase [Shigella dysenteriae 1617]AHA68099.1 Transposase [Shigella dysenteriae 1617]AHA68401.1 Transposase [Shigella dysenteriae 1617]